MKIFLKLFVVSTTIFTILFFIVLWKNYKLKEDIKELNQNYSKRVQEYLLMTNEAEKSLLKLKNDSSEYIETNKRLNEDLKNIKLKYDNQLQEFESLQSFITEIEALNKSLTDKNNQLLKNNVALENELDNYKIITENKIQEYEIKYNESLNNIDELKSENLKFEATVEEQNNKINKLNNLLEETKKLVLDKDKDIENKNNELLLTKSKLSSVVDELNNLKIKLSDEQSLKEEKLFNLENSLKEKNLLYNELKTQYEEKFAFQTNEIEKYKNEIINLGIEYKNLNDSYNKVLNDNNGLKQEIEKLKKSLSEMIESIEKTNENEYDKIIESDTKTE